MFARSTDPRSVRIIWPRLSARTFVNRLINLDATYRQRLAMAKLDERMLRDIGATRADIATELRRPLPW